MPTPDDTPSPFTEWRAENVGQLRKIWTDLHTESSHPNTIRQFGQHSLTLRQAGEVFERWVVEAFRLSGASGHYGFRVPLTESDSTREQIDGLIVDGWQGFLVESKFWTEKVDFGPLVLLHHHTGTRPLGTRGLMFSAFGYTAPALESAKSLHPTHILLLTGEDLNWALQATKWKGRMLEMVRRKWLLTMMYGDPGTPVSDPVELFNL